MDSKTAQLTDQLGVRIKDNKVILTGSINEFHEFDPFTATKIVVKLSNGSNLTFEFNSRFDHWCLVDHNLIEEDQGKYYERETSQDYGISDKVLFKHKVSTAWVMVNGTNLRMYGDPVMSKDQIEQYDTLLKYLLTKGVICLDQMQRDLKLIITGHFKTPVSHG